MKYEIYFLGSPNQEVDNSLVFQVEAKSLEQAWILWADEWPEGIAYTAKEGWSEATGGKIVSHGARPKTVSDSVPLSPLAKRLKTRQQERGY